MLAARYTFLLDRDAVIRRVRAVEDVVAHRAELLDAARALAAGGSPEAGRS